MQKKRRNGRATTETPVEDEIAHLRGPPAASASPAGAVSGWRVVRNGDRARDNGLSISQTTLFIAASREMAWPDLIVFSSRRTVHLHELASVPSKQDRTNLPILLRRSKNLQ